MVAPADASEAVFRVNFPLLKAMIGGDDSYQVGGVASTQSKDQQGETVWQNGVDFAPLLNGGFINWNHKEGPQAQIGEPTMAKITELGAVHGYVIKSGQSRNDPCFYFEGKLYKGRPWADEAWGLLQTLKKGGESGAYRNKLGWSVEGGIRERRGTQLVKTIVRHMALTHEPVNLESEALAMSVSQHRDALSGIAYVQYGSLAAFAKSFSKAVTMGDMGALQLEMLAGSTPISERARQAALGMTIHCKPGQRCHNDVRYQKGIPGMYDHLTQCGGADPETARLYIEGLAKALR